MFQGVVKASAAFRLMQQMGWEEGNGLGKNEQGMKQHLRVKNKQDTAGIGNDVKSHKWALNTVEYDSILKDLKVVAAAVTGAKSDSGAVDGDVKEEVQVLAKKVTRPQGRYKRKKIVGEYSQSDLQAILGGAGEKTDLQAMVQQSRPERTTEVAVAISEPVKQSIDVVSQKDSKSKKECKSKKASKSNSGGKSEGKIVEDIKDEVSDAHCPSFPSYPADWWGHKYGFVSAGSMGATTGEQAKDRTAFREEDQENLYNQVKENATTGRKGLGKGDQKVRKFEHGDWKGQKKSLDLASDEETEAANVLVAQEDKQLRKKERKKQRAKEREMEGNKNVEQSKCKKRTSAAKMIEEASTKRIKV